MAELSDDNSVRLESAEPLTILGASVRAAAESARRAFFAPVLADLFADLDTQELGSTTRIDEYPQGFEHVLTADHGGGWIYTGALENYPELIARWSNLRPLLGNGAEVLGRVRDPWQVADCLARAGLSCPHLSRTADQLARDGSWLQKPFRSAAGQGIQRVAGERHLAANAVYFQKHVEGQSHSAVYVGQGGESQLLGITKQRHLPGSFAYAGSIGPVELNAEDRRQVVALGKVLTAEFGLVGLFGVDFILNDDGVWPVEINPRYTASVEILERALGLPAIALHMAACRNQSLAAPDLPKQYPIVGKQILFASHDVTIPCDLRNEFSDLADIPSPGSTIQRGAPVLTLFRTGPCCDEVSAQLATATTELDSRLAACSPFRNP